MIPVLERTWRQGGGPATDEETIVLVAGASESFAIGLTVSLSSAVRHLDADRRVHVFVLDGGLSDRSLDHVRSSLAAARDDAEVTVVAHDAERFAGYMTHGYGPAALLRLLIPEVVPRHYRRALYLDSDLVVTGDIAELWDLPDDGSVFRAAIDEGVRRGNYTPNFDVADFPAGTPYFNSGVILIDLPRWRAEGCSERALEVLARHGEQCLAPDQDALNLVGMGRWTVLPPAWNYQVAGTRIWPDLAPDDPSIAVTHFLDFKPWRRQTECVRQAVFDEALRESGWYTPNEFLRYRIGKSMDDAGRWVRKMPARAQRRIVSRTRRLFAH